MTCCACDRAAEVRGLCRMHYQRLRKIGSLTLPTARDRFKAKVIKDDETGCWNWAGYISPADGYGRFGDRRVVHLAHRWSYTTFVGPITSARPHIDHLCRNRRCVSPAHLEAVTQAENNRRAVEWRIPTPPMERCRQGHLMDEANSYPRADRPGKYACRTCQARWQRDYYARRKQANANV